MFLILKPEFMDRLLHRFKRKLLSLQLSLLLLCCYTVSANANDFKAEMQSLRVTGHVTSADDKSDLPGVNVLVKGTLIGSVTDMNGNYTIDVPSKDVTLVFSYIGYTVEEIVLGEKTVVDVALTPDVQSLSEVVVVGYGTQKKADITGAVATFKTDQIEERPLARVDQALVGQMAGVRVQQTSGVPGRGFSIQVRGTGSISANTEPLYVIDGFPLEPSQQNTSGTFSTGNPLDNINPNDIESIQVLKDASAAAIYGSRAANGVVIIKTKSGQSSGKSKITMSAYTGVTQAVRKLDVLNADQWIDRATEIINSAWVNSGPGRTADQTTDQRRTILGLAPGAVNTNYMVDDRWSQPGHPGLTYVNWQDLLFRTGVTQNYEVSGSGGTDAARFFISGGYLDQKGIALGLDYKRFATRANVDIKANDKLKFGINISPSYSIADDPGVDGKDQQLHAAVSVAPIVETSTGAWNNNVGSYPGYLWGQTRPGILASVTQTTGATKIFRTLNTVYGEYKLLESLTIRSTVNYDNEDQTFKRFTPAAVTGASPAARASTGSASGFRRQNFANENTLTFNKTFGGHSLNVLGGFSFNSFNFSNYTINGSTYSSDLISTINAATVTNGNTTETKSVLLSYFGRAQYSFNGKYLFTASIRRDGSSKFGPSTKWGVFPSLSAGWRISEENFMANLSSVVSDLKLRGSWGIAGNNGIPDYGSIGLMQFTNTSFGGTIAKGLSPQNYPNANLSWEKSQTVNIGLDFGFIQNRIHASVDYYTKDNSGLLLNVPVPASSGYGVTPTTIGTALTNVGEVLNKGFEVELHTRNLTGALQWTTDINVSHNTNQVKKLGPGNAPIYSGGSTTGGFDIDHRVMQVGYPMNSLFLVQNVGVLSTADINDGYPIVPSETAGDPKYIDANGDGKIDANDRVIMAKSPYPKYIWGITNTFKWKRFDLNIFIQGQNGGYMYSMFGRAVDRVGQGYMDNTLAKYADRWRSDADPGNGSHKAYSTSAFIKNTDWLYSSDYWRVRNITLGYNLGALLKRKAITASRVYITAENWFGKDYYKGGFNPEAVNTAGEDYGGFPLSKSIIVGLNMSF